MGEKRRKLAETWDRVIKIYEKENPDQYTELKKLWMNYQGRKIEVVKYYESVMSAQVITALLLILEPNFKMLKLRKWMWMTSQCQVLILVALMMAWEEFLSLPPNLPSLF